MLTQDHTLTVIQRTAVSWLNQETVSQSNHETGRSLLMTLNETIPKPEVYAHPELAPALVKQPAWTWAKKNATRFGVAVQLCSSH